jgi:16S rRNA (cytosine1402-N4)-methyltransferase
MLDEVIGFLDPKPNNIYVDATLGTGGHAEALLTRGARVIGVDLDPYAIEVSKTRLARFGKQISYVHGNFKDLDRILDEFKITSVDGILYDLGTSSLQLQNPRRGFSLYEDGPLDMRMDPDEEITCFHLVNHLPEEEIGRIIRVYGEDWWARRIARRIVKEREKKGSIETTLELAEIVASAIPGRRRVDGHHPATRTFQAFRIAVNNELENLKHSLAVAISYLRPGGRVVGISFHSLEDRIIKHSFLEWARRDLPLIRILTKKPLRPSEEEVERNPRARSAKLRAALRLSPGRG